MARCGMVCEVYSRVVGYHRPVSQWNTGKSEEFKERVEFDTKEAIERCDEYEHGSRNK